MCLNELNFFWILTQRIELFSWRWRNELNLLWPTELNHWKKWLFLLEKNSNCRTLLLVTQRIDFFSTWLTELNPIFYYYRIEPFFSTWFIEIEHFFCWQIWLKVPVYPFWKICLKELNSLFEYDSKNWTFFKNWLKDLNFFFKITQRIEPSFKYDSKIFWKTTRRIEHLFFQRLKECNFFC